MAESTHLGLALFYHEMPGFDKNPRPAPINDMHEVIALTAPRADRQWTAVNLFEQIKISYVPCGKSLTDANAISIEEWGEQFRTSLWACCHGLTRLRALASSIGKDFWESAEYIALAKSMGEAIEMGKLLLAISVRISERADAIEDFLSQPMSVETCVTSAVDVAKRIVLKFAAHAIAKQGEQPSVDSYDAGSIDIAKPPLTLAQIWSANPDLNQSAKERVRKKLEYRASKNPTLNIKVKEVGTEFENAYDAQIVSIVLQEERKLHGKSPP